MFRKPTGGDDTGSNDVSDAAERRRQAAGGAASPQPPKAEGPGSAKPMIARAKADGTTSHSVIDELLTMRGDIETEGNVQIKGRVYGNISCVSLIVEDGAVVSGEIHAQEVVVRGQTSGAIHSRLVRLEATAIVESDVYHQSFACEQGARIQGRLSYRDAASDEQTTSPSLSRPTPNMGSTPGSSSGARIRQDLGITTGRAGPTSGPTSGHAE